MNINLSLLAQALTFALFIWFTIRFIWPPLLRAIEQRQKQIAEGLAAAERGKQDLEQASRRTADLLSDARRQVLELVTALCIENHTVVVASHDPEIIRLAILNRVHVADGHIESDD